MKSDKKINIAKSIGLIWQIIKAKEIDAKTKYKMLLDFDKTPDLKPDEAKPLNDKIVAKKISEETLLVDEEIPEEVLELKEERDTARKEKNWQKSDELREEIEREGYLLEDKDGKTIIRKNPSSLI